MPVRPNDTVSLSLRAPVHLSRYLILKPSVTVTRVIGEDVQADMADLSATVRALYREALAVEVGLHDEMSRLIEDGDIDKIADYAIRKESPRAETRRKKKSRKAR